MHRDPGILSRIKPYRDDYQGMLTADVASALDLSLETPRFVPAEHADYMRDDDQVLSVLFRGEARAYPFWIWDYHHVVNDEWMGHPVFVAG